MCHVLARPVLLVQSHPTAPGRRLELKGVGATAKLEVETPELSVFDASLSAHEQTLVFSRAEVARRVCFALCHVRVC